MESEPQITPLEIETMNKAVRKAQKRWQDGLPFPHPDDGIEVFELQQQGIPPVVDSYGQIVYPSG